MSRHISAIPAAVIDDPAVTDGMLRMLLVLGAYANRDGWCWPKLETIAGRLSIEKPAVSKMLSRLREAGYLDVHYEIREGRRRCVFRVLYDRPLATASAIEDDEYAEGLESAAPVSLRETQQRVASVSFRETQEPPRVSQTDQLRETDSFLPEGNGPLITSPVEQTRSVAPADAGGSSRVIEAWNAMAAGAGLPKARLTPKRAKVIATRLREFGWLEDFTGAIGAIAESPFHRGANDRAWMATIDFVLRPGKATELAERAAAVGRPAPPRASASSQPGSGTVELAPGVMLTQTRLWDLCRESGLTAAMLSKTTVGETITRLVESGEIGNGVAFASLVMHVQPWSIAEIKFPPEQQRVLAERLASWPLRDAQHDLRLTAGVA